MSMRWIGTIALGAALCAGGAQASEPTQEVLSSWAGPYIGAHIGYGWGKNEWRDFIDPVNPPNVVPGPDADFSLRGVLGGGQIGYNWQFGSTVFGIEAAASAANINGTGDNAPNPTLYPGGCLQQNDCNTKIQAFGTLTARIGTVVDRALVYAKGGAAWGVAKHSTGASDPDFPNDPYANYSASVDQTRWGWTIGAGIEYALAPGWSAKLEYNYIDLGKDQATFRYQPDQSFAARADSELSLHTVTLGVNYRFGE